MDAALGTSARMRDSPREPGSTGPVLVRVLRTGLWRVGSVIQVYSTQLPELLKTQLIRLKDQLGGGSD